MIQFQDTHLFKKNTVLLSKGLKLLTLKTRY